MNQAPPEPSPDHDRNNSDGWKILAAIGAVLALLALCSVGPVWLGRHCHPVVGLLASVAGFFAWARFGPKPMPGLLQGIICLNGFAAIICGFLIQIIPAIKWLSR